MLGLGVAGLFKMSCDSRSCLVYTGPNFEKENKVIKYNEKCYNVREKMLDCKDKKGLVGENAKAWDSPTKPFPIIPIFFFIIFLI